MNDRTRKTEYDVEICPEHNNIHVAITCNMIIPKVLFLTQQLQNGDFKKLWDFCDKFKQNLFTDNKIS
jgi:hypothetical protein